MFPTPYQAGVWAVQEVKQIVRDYCVGLDYSYANQNMGLTFVPCTSCMACLDLEILSELDI